MKPACFLARFDDGPCLYRDDGRPDRCHMIPKQRLKRADLEAEAWDPRVYVLSCRRHHHLFDNGFIELEPLDYPVHVWDFARDHSFEFFPGRGWLHVSPDVAREGSW